LKILENGHFVVELLCVKKWKNLDILTSGEDTQLYKKAESIKKHMVKNIVSIQTMKLKSHIVSTVIK
jgi:hypothetical protein